MPWRIAGDGVRLTQVLVHLLGNASKYAPRGGGIRLSVRGDPGGVAIVVIDTPAAGFSA